MSKPLNYFKTRPKVPAINVVRYLERLQVERSSPDLAFLKLLHRQHLMHVPVENLDIHYGRKIILDIPKIYKKVVGERRGGLCYELNPLFYHLLVNLGFDARLGAARRWLADSVSPPFEQAIIFVKADRKIFLADVGSADLFSEPREIQLQSPQLDFTEYYRFQKTPDDMLILKKSATGVVYLPVYEFGLKSHELIEFIPRCNFHQDNPASVHRQQKLISALFKEGRVTLTDRQLRKVWKGEVFEKAIGSEDEFLALVSQYFQIDRLQLVRQQFE